MLYHFLKSDVMASIKIVLRKKANKDGTLPLALRITKDRKTSFIHIGYSIKDNDWDKVNSCVKKSHPNSARLNNLLLKKLSEATNTALEVETNKTIVSASSVRQKIKPSVGATFFAQADAFVERLKEAGKYNQYTSEKPRLKHFKEFLGGDIAFQDITPVMLEKYRAHVINKLKLSERSAVNHLVSVRSVFSHAIRDNVIDAKYYPFGKGGVKIKFPDTTKVGLTIEEVKRLEEVELDDPKLNHARNLWLFSFYFAGMRVSDVFRVRWSDLQDNRLHYSMGKNNKGGSFSIPDKAMRIIEQYRAFQDNKNNLIFPELKECDFENKFSTNRTIGFKTSAVDKCLRTQVAPVAEITKTLTMHIARHTFASISGDKIPLQLLQKLYRHSSITTTVGYQANFINKDTDDALNSVLNY
jgi:site-specific recombinase XerD